jgi:prolipoprotein diacylglyceryl transferase
MTIANFVASIPSPSESTIDLGFARIHYYALFILLGIAVAVYWSNRRLVKRGGESGLMLDVAIWAVPFGIVGARLFHVVTHLNDYVGEGKDLLKILYVWEGGLAIYGGLIFGVLGAYLGARQANLKLLSVADALAPAVLLAQAIGRWGNYFNQELFGKPTDLPWAIQIDAPNPAIPSGWLTEQTFHPTFFYEFLWSVAGVVILLLLERRLNLRWGRMFAAYLIYYSVGRFWIEDLRIDPSDVLLGLRTNQWSAVVGVVVGIALIIWSRKRHPGLEESVYTTKPEQKAKEV